MRWLLVWLLLASIWGSTWLFIKLGLEDLPPFTFAGIRFVVALLPLLVLLRARRTPLPRRVADWRLLAVTGLLTFTVDYGLIFWGETTISSGLTAILFSTFPLFGLVFAHLLLPAEPLRARKLAGVVLGIAGVTVIFADQIHLDDRLGLAGAVAIIVAAAAAAFSNVLLKARGTHLDPAVVTAGQMAVGLVPLLAVGLSFEGSPLGLRWTPLALVSLLYLALVGSTLTFVLYYRLIQAIEVTTAQLIPLFSTVIAVLLGWLVLDETLSARALAGGAMVLAGLLAAVTAPKARRSAA